MSLRFVERIVETALQVRLGFVIACVVLCSVAFLAGSSASVSSPEGTSASGAAIHCLGEGALVSSVTICPTFRANSGCDPELRTCVADVLAPTTCCPAVHTEQPQTTFHC
jgi:hypothetical protein